MQAIILLQHPVGEHHLDDMRHMSASSLPRFNPTIFEWLWAVTENWLVNRLPWNRIERE